MSESSEGKFVKCEPPENLKHEILTNVEIEDTIDLQHALVIVPGESDSNLEVNTLHQNDKVVVVATMTSNGELITSDQQPTTTETESVKVTKVEPIDPNTCSYCGKCFKSQTTEVVEETMVENIDGLLI